MIFLRTFFLFLFLFFVGFFYGCSNLIENSIVDTLEVPVILPEKNNIFGSELLRVLELSFDEINSQGGILGKEVELVIFDGSCDFESSKKIAREIVLEDYKFVIGGICSDETLGAGLVMQDNGVVMISPASISSRVSNLGNYIFRTVPSVRDLSIRLAKEIYADGYKSVFVIKENSGYTDSVLEDFSGEYNSLGGEIKFVENFNYSVNFDVLIDKIGSSDFDSLFLIFQRSDVAKIFLSYLENSDFDSQIYGEVILVTDFSYLYGGEKVNGAKLIYPVIDENSNEVKLFKDNFFNSYGLKTNKFPFFYYASTYDLPFILKKAIESCGIKNYNSECIRDNLFLFEYGDGLLKNFSFDVNGEPIMNFGVYRIDEGEVVLVK